MESCNVTIGQKVSFGANFCKDRARFAETKQLTRLLSLYFPCTSRFVVKLSIEICQKPAWRNPFVTILSALAARAICFSSLPQYPKKSAAIWGQLRLFSPSAPRRNSPLTASTVSRQEGERVSLSGKVPRFAPNLSVALSHCRKLTPFQSRRGYPNVSNGPGSARPAVYRASEDLEIKSNTRIRSALGNSARRIVENFNGR